MHEIARIAPEVRNRLNSKESSGQVPGPLKVENIGKINYDTFIDVLQSPELVSCAAPSMKNDVKSLQDTLLQKSVNEVINRVTGTSNEVTVVVPPKTKYKR